MNVQRNLAISELYRNACSFILNTIIESGDNFMKRMTKRRTKLHRRLLNNVFKSKRHRTRQRYDSWWKKVVESDYPDAEMLANFRMKKETFLYIVDKVREDLQPSPYSFMPCLNANKIVAIARFKMATCAENRVVGIAFGVAESTVRKCFHRFCTSLVKNCMKSEISLPTSVEDVQRISSQFEEKCKIGPIVGAIDGTHIPITPPQDGYRDYINRKGWPSMILQVVVDASLLFRNIVIKHPGSCHDAKVLRDSALYNSFQDIIPNHSKIIDNIEVFPFLIGDPAYPLLPWLIKGFSGPKTIEEESFNMYLSSGRVVAEMAIGRLKSRWRILCKRMDVHYKRVPNVIAACCILHNIVERHKTNFVTNWLEETQVYCDEYPQPPTRFTVAFEASGKVIRQHLKNELRNNYPLRRGNSL